MNNEHSREEVLATLQDEETAVVATLGGRKEIRTRKMHFAADQDFNLYLATLKDDPKTVQITHHPTVSLLVYNRQENLSQSSEIEISGRASKVKGKEKRKKALNLLKEVSPVVEHLTDEDKAHQLEVIKVVPATLKYRVFQEITEGIPPTVLEFSERREEPGPGALAQLARKSKIWWMELRPSFLLASLTPLLLGGLIGWSKTGQLLWPSFLLTLCGGLLLHIGTNMVNDYFDHRSGNDKANREFVRPFSGGSRMIQLGLLTPLETLTGGLLSLGLGSLIGFYLAWSRGLLILLIGLVGVISGFFYSSPPFKFAARGVGELLVGFNFGVLMTLGSYYVQTQSLDWEPVLAGIPLMLLTTAILYINEFPDYKADKKVGKKTLVVRLGRKKALYVYTATMTATYLALALESLTGSISPYGGLGLLSLPLAYKGIHYARDNYRHPFDLVPANASTIMAHLTTGSLLMAAYVLERLGLRGFVALVFLGVLTGLVIFWLNGHIKAQKETFAKLRKSLRQT